jgi:mono/diheme cytochrome c family protein
MNNIAGRATVTCGGVVCGRVAPRLGSDSHGELRSNSPTFNNRLGVTAVLAAFALLASASSQAAEPRDLEQVVQPFLKKYCVECHGAGVPKSDFRVDNLSPKVGTENTPQWLEIMERINSGQMPPEDAKVRPTANESGKIVEWIAARMKEGEAARMAARGRVSFNRLTRDEYVNTVRDLIGVEYDAKDPGALLEDPEWHGFERIGSVLTLSPSNIAKYLTAAETVLAEAYPDPPPKNATPAPPFGGSKRAVPEEQINERHRERLRALGLLDKVRYEMWPGDIFRGSMLRGGLPEAGIYEISYTLSGLQPENGRAPRLKVYTPQLDRVLFEQDIVAPEDKPVTVTFQAHFPKGGLSIEVYNDVPGPSNRPFSGRHSEVPFISTKIGRTPWQMKLTDEAGNARYPFLIMDSVSWKGPIIEDHEKQLRDDYMPREDGNMQQVRECLATLAKRAFRRPVTDEEIGQYMRIVQSELAAKETFRNAVKAGMLAILNSKSFLFIAEGDENVSRQTLNDWEIASRLSYLLWNTMPDAELFALAEQGKLRDKAVLAQQVARLLADARSQRFTDSFATQWLRLKKVGMFQPDKKLYPEYDKALENSMVGETKAFFREVLAGGLTLREFLHSDWSMLNLRLAQFYGLPEGKVRGGEFQRVSLPADSHRGGLLTQASILSLTSDGVRHRPVHRGVWVMESIFGKSPPPPPANVNPIPTNPTGPKATLRQKLEAHIHDANCAVCHAKIDPLGLAFENYDAIGRWRTEEVTDGIGENPKVTAAGKLPDGRVYQTADEFKKLLVADLDAFNHTFIEKLATYALRRSMSFDDRDHLKAVAAASKAEDYRVTDIVTALVTSDLFQKR